MTQPRLSSSPIGTPLLLFLTSALALFAAGSAKGADPMPDAMASTVAVEGRLLAPDGAPIANATNAVTVACYAAADAETAYATAAATLATDVNGDYAALLPVTLPPDDATQMWVGITPDGGTEIVPRTRVSTAPFAIRAASVDLIKADTLAFSNLSARALEGTPNATIGTLAVSQNAYLQQLPQNIGKLDIGTLHLGAYSSLAALHAEQGGLDTAYWNNIRADVGGTSTPGGRFPAVTNTVTAQADGFVCFYIQFALGDIVLLTENCHVSITVGDIPLMENRRLTFSASSEQEKYSCRAIVFPIRKGETATLTLSYAGAPAVAKYATFRRKIRLYSFGAEP